MNNPLVLKKMTEKNSNVLVLVLVLVFVRAQLLPIFNRCISRLLPARASSCTAAPNAGPSWLPRHYCVMIYFWRSCFVSSVPDSVA